MEPDGGIASTTRPGTAKFLSWTEANTEPISWGVEVEVGVDVIVEVKVIVGVDVKGKS